MDSQFLFIIGSARSGTTWLQAMMGRHPGVCTTVELTLFSRYTAPWIQAWGEEATNIKEGRWSQGLPFLWTEETFYDFLGEFAERVYQEVLSTKPKATHILDKHPGYSMYVDDIDRILPHSRFIHVIRDGRDVALSMLAARERAGFGARTFPDAARVWRRSVLAAQKARRFEGRYLEVRYEDLLGKGADILRQVFEFCGLSASEDEIAAIWEEHQFEKMRTRRQTGDQRVQASAGHYRKGAAGGWRAQLSPVQRRVFYQIAGDLLEDLGFAQEAWWASSRWQQLVLPIASRISLGIFQSRRRLLRAGSALLGPELTERVMMARSAKA